MGEDYSLVNSNLRRYFSASSTRNINKIVLNTGNKKIYIVNKSEIAYV